MDQLCLKVDVFKRVMESGDCYAMAMAIAMAIPILKTAGKAVGKQLLNTGAGVVRDLLDGDNLGASAEKQFKGAASNLLDEASISNNINPVPQPTMKRARRKVKRMKGSGLDIFA